MTNKTITIIKNFFTNPKIRFGYLSRLGLLNYVNDKKYIEREYYLYFHKKINLDNPKTFNEKIQYLKSEFSFLKARVKFWFKFFTSFSFLSEL